MISECEELVIVQVTHTGKLSCLRGPILQGTYVFLANYGDSHTKTNQNIANEIQDMMNHLT